MNTYFGKLLITIAGLCLTILGFFPNVALAQTNDYTPPSQSVTALTGIPFNQATPVDEVYRKEFENCDKNNLFKGEKMSRDRGCSDDQNNVKALLRFPDGTIFFESKLSLDIDGSWKVCEDSSVHSSQCPTSYNWPNISQKPDKYVDPDNYPYIVIPTTNVVKGEDREFRNKTRVDIGDLGIVVYKNKIVPVFVADGGPHNKLGEGSSSLHKLIGEDKCKSGMWRDDGTTRPDKKWTSDIYCLDHKDYSVSDKVLFFVFPGSRTAIAGLSPTQALAKIQSEAHNRFEKLKENSPSVLKLNQPTPGQSFAVNTPVAFSGTAAPEVSIIKVTIGPGGPFSIAELKDVGEKWTFTQTFRNTGKDRPVTLQPFDLNDRPLKSLTFTITIQ